MADGRTHLHPHELRSHLTYLFDFSVSMLNSISNRHRDHLSTSMCGRIQNNGLHSR